MNIGTQNLKRALLTLAVTTFAAMTFSLMPSASADPPTPPTPPAPAVVINSIPLSVVAPTTPQVLFALTNSMSMDSSDNIIDDANSDLSIPAGTTHARAPSSAIMTWSGGSGTWTSGSPSTSPANYQVPAGFVAPVSGATEGSSTPYVAALNGYSVTTPGHWGNSGSKCVDLVTVPYGSSDVSISNPFTSGYPPPTPTGYPGGSWGWGIYVALFGSLTRNLYYNGTGSGFLGTGFFYGSQPASFPFPDAISHQLSMNYIPNTRALFHGEARELAVNGNAGLRAVGMGSTPPVVIPQAIGSVPPPPPCGTGPGESGVACPPPGGGGTPTTQTVCGVYMYIPPQYVNSQSTPFQQQADNSASRLNIAKASIAQVIQAYGTQVNFGLMTYNVNGVNQNYYSLAYYMSTPGGFTAADFSNTYQAPTYAAAAASGAPPAITSEWVNNPCYGSAAGNNGCSIIIPKLQTDIGISIGSYRFMQVANSSDDPQVNDAILIANTSYAFLLGDKDATHVRKPSSPYPPSPPGFTLGDYNSGNTVSINYPGVWPSQGGDNTYNMSPTNSGYVPYSDQVIASLRGKPWAGTPTANAGNVLVPVTAAAGVSLAEQQAYLQMFTPYLTPENTVASNDTDPVLGVLPTISYYDYYKNAIEASAMQSPVAGLLSTALNASSWPAPSATPVDCPPPKYVILVTDGLPTEDMQGKNWPPPGSAAAQGYGATVAFNADGTLDAANTNNAAVTEAISEIATLNQNGIKTFVVGLGPGVNPSLNPTAAKVLTAMAKAGGTTKYFPGTNPAAVVEQLNTILNIINHLNVAAVSAAFNSSGLNTNSVAYQATYTGYAKPYKDWTGDLQAFSLLVGNDGLPSTTANWSAQCELDKSATGGTCGATGGPGTGTGWQSRVIATCGSNPGDGCAPGSGHPFEWSDLHGQMDNALRLIPGDHGTTPGQDRLNFLRGDTSNDEANGGTLRNRSHILGDIVDSTPLYIAAPDSPYGGMPGYNQFASDLNSRTPMLYVGANDGMLHAFETAGNVTTGTVGGKEAFAFIPNGVFSKLIDLTDPNYNNNHQFYVDGSPSAGDVRFADGSWHTVLAGGLNDGGHSIYALDVTNPSAITSAASASAAESILANDVLWEFTDPHLGLTFSRPAFTLTTDTSSPNANRNGFLVFFGSGYNNSDQNPYLYAVNPETGGIVSKDVSQSGAPLGAINLCAAVTPDPCNHSASNGLSGVAVVNDNGIIGGPATTVYAGDLQGHLWKVDISSPDPANWTVTLLFTATDASGTPQPITDTPVVSLNPQYPGVTGTVVYFGTGQYLGTPDISTTGTQSFYGVLDNGTVYSPTSPTACNIVANQYSMTRCELVQQSLTDVTYSNPVNGNNVAVRTVTSTGVNWNAQKGWYIDLPLAGERVVTDPKLYAGKVVFTTYVPSPAATTACSVGGQSYLMVLNYATGGAFATPQLDLNNDGMLNSADQADSKNVVGVSMGNVYSSAPGVLAVGFASKDVRGAAYVPGSGLNNLGSNLNLQLGFSGGPVKITWTQLQGDGS